MFKKVIIALSALLICNISSNFDYLNILAENNSDVSYINVVSAEINESFDDSSVLIFLKPEYSELHKIWTINDFSIDNISYITDLTDYHFDNLQEEQNYLNSTNFSQILQITLQRTGKQEVLNFLNNLKILNPIFVSTACVNYTDILEESNSNIYSNRMMREQEIEDYHYFHSTLEEAYNEQKITKLWKYTIKKENDYNVYGN